MDVAFPYRIDRSGRTAAETGDDHIRSLIEQLLFTAPGERVNRPTFGSGVLQLVYRLDVNEYRGVETPQLIVEQIATLQAGNA